ncbi:hypothetical protein R3W88_017175 [Solanum pinnatisectum]|uniref:Uncharacterized protein n=1 Tax=Solanum pinnatisectum TaxID=50273 RepID=A0AAV9KZG7_9SOLN|nr:hypothetical protein R3W88_017175 [Solanum pinnatisectum]
MGRGRPRRANQRHRKEEIHHGIASSSAAGQLTRSETIEEVQMFTPDGPPLQLMNDASKGKGKAEMNNGQSS